MIALAIFGILALIACLTVVVRRASRQASVAARQLAILAELGHRALDTDDPLELLDLVVHRVGRALGAELVEVLELEGEKGRLVLRAGCGFRSGLVGLERLDLSQSRRVGRALDSGEPVIMRAGIRRSRSQLEALLVEHGVRSGITVPIPGRASGFGTLAVHSRKRRRFKAEDAHLLEATASLLALAIEARRTEQEARANQRNLAFLNEASGQLAASLGPGAVLETLARVVRPFLADFLLVDLVGENGTLQRLVGASDGGESRLLPARSGTAPLLRVVAVANGRAGVHRARCAGDATDDELQRIATDSEQLELLRRAQLSSVMIVPLAAGERVLGSVCLGAQAPRSRYGPVELALASDLAHRTALALDKAQTSNGPPELDSRKGEFLALLSWELRDSIARLSNTIEVLRLSQTDGSDSHASEIAAHEVSGMRGLVADLLDVSRTAREAIELHREPLELGGFVQQAFESARLALSSGSRETELELPEAPLWIDGDPVRLEQILGTLFDRAGKSAGQQATLRVRVEAQSGGRWSAIRMWDEGRGESSAIPSPASSSEARGEELELGVDLYLVQSLAELHGGEVSIQRRGAQGEREFVVRLPSIPAPARTSTHRSSAAEQASGVRVLVVDDQRDLATGLAELLARWGHEARVAFDGPSGLEAARGFQPDLVLLDLGLPGMDGYAVAETLRREPSLSSLEVAALTGYAHADDRHRARECGIDHYFTKPVDLTALRRLLDSRTGKVRRPRMDLR
jgi:CheY-like chemotaxis protein